MGSTSAGSTSAGSTSAGSTSAGSTSSGSTSTGSASSGTTKSSSAYSGIQSAQTGETDSQTTDSQVAANDNTQDQNVGATAEEIIEDNGFSTSPGGPTAMIGLFVVIGLISMAFPYKEGGLLNQFQTNLFGK